MPGRVSFDLLSDHDQVKLRMYLPAGTGRMAANLPFSEERVGESRYLVFERLPERAHVEIFPA